jgi:hypothetical protein
MSSIIFWFSRNTDADPFSLLTTNRPCSDSPTSRILVFAEPRRLWGLFESFGVRATDFTTPFSIQTRRGSSEVEDESTKKSSGVFSILEGICCVVNNSPVSAERAVTWRVYEAYDFASPIAYTVEPVTIRRSSITKDLKHYELKGRWGGNHPQTSVPGQPTTKANHLSFHRSDIPHAHLSRRTHLLHHG